MCSLRLSHDTLPDTPNGTDPPPHINSVLCSLRPATEVTAALGMPMATATRSRRGALGGGSATRLLINLPSERCVEVRALWTASRPRAFSPPVVEEELELISGNKLNKKQQLFFFYQLYQ